MWPMFVTMAGLCWITTYAMFMKYHDAELTIVLSVCSLIISIGAAITWGEDL